MYDIISIDFSRLNDGYLIEDNKIYIILEKAIILKNFEIPYLIDEININISDYATYLGDEGIPFKIPFGCRINLIMLYFDSDKDEKRNFKVYTIEKNLTEDEFIKILNILRKKIKIKRQHQFQRIPLNPPNLYHNINFII